MRIRMAVAVSITVMLATAAACGGSDGYYPTGGGGGGSGGGGGGGGGAPAATVTIGSGIQFVSDHNGTMNPAVDTIPAGSTMSWTWTGTLPHSVRSVGATSFASSDTRTGSSTYVVTFPTSGTYRYECAVHGAAMTGTIVVKPASTTSPSSYGVSGTVTDPTGPSQLLAREIDR